MPGSYDVYSPRQVYTAWPVRCSELAGFRAQASQASLFKLRPLFSSSLSTPQIMSGSPKCTKCSLPLEGLSQQYHDRLVHQQKATVAYPAEQPQILKRVLGQFKCLRCHFNTPDPTRLQEHVRGCQALNPDVHPTPPDFTEPVLFPRRTPPTTPSSSPSRGAGAPGPSSPNSSPVPPPRPNLPQDIDDLPTFYESEYFRVPEPTTITSHPTLPLRACSIVINVELGGVIICVNCGCCVTPNDVYDHVRGHFHELQVPRDLGSRLQEEFSLTPWRDIPFPSTIREPVFGLKIFPEPFYFCLRCGHGYQNDGALAAHQSSTRCPRSAGEKHEHYVAYGQSFGFTSSKFAVDISNLLRHEDAQFDASTLYTTTFAPPPDYSLLP
ncbi:hypothetical protein B0H11DRAFT_2290910 [Mycena galericulata]|nr:hypothetical protein B0H11DRAFT_2290910 [Mycena galericulata]